MRGMRVLLGAMAMAMAAAPEAFAAEAVKVYSSSMLVLAFVGFLALIVAIQLIPAVMTLVGTLKGIIQRSKQADTAQLKAGN